MSRYPCQNVQSKGLWKGKGTRLDDASNRRESELERVCAKRSRKKGGQESCRRFGCDEVRECGKVIRSARAHAFDSVLLLEFDCASEHDCS